MCVGEVRSKGQDELLADIRRLKDAMAAHGASEGFMNAASPGVISLFLQNDFYPSRDAYLAALADAMAEEYRTIVDAGLYLQLDCPRPGAEPPHAVRGSVGRGVRRDRRDACRGVLNGALDGIDPSRVRAHICWGNYEGPHVCDVADGHGLLDLPQAAGRPAPVRDVESRATRTNGRSGTRGAPRSPTTRCLVPGVIDSTTNFVEQPGGGGRAPGPLLADRGRATG